jgi:ribonuclease HI
MYFDSALNINGARAGIMFIMPTKDKLWYVLRIHFPASNNAAEYEACLHGLRIAIELGVKCLMVYSNSALVINQLNKDWSCSSEKIDTYCAEIRKLEGKFFGIEYHHVVRDQNQLTDHLSKPGSSHAAIPPGVFGQDLLAPSIKEDKEVEEVPPAEQLVLAVPSLVTD